MLLGTAALCVFAHNALVSSDAHPTLPVTSQGVMTGEHVSTETFVGLVSSMNLSMAFQIVATDEALVAMIAFELAVTQVGLDMGLDILLPAKPSFTAWMEADPFAILGVRARDVRSDLIDGDTGLVDGCVDPFVKVQVVNRRDSRGELWLRRSRTRGCSSTRHPLVAWCSRINGNLPWPLILT